MLRIAKKLAAALAAFCAVVASAGTFLLADDHFDTEDTKIELTSAENTGSVFVGDEGVHYVYAVVETSTGENVGVSNNDNEGVGAPLFMPDQHLSYDAKERKFGLVIDFRDGTEPMRPPPVFRMAKDRQWIILPANTEWIVGGRSVDVRERCYWVFNLAHLDVNATPEGLEECHPGRRVLPRQ